MELFVSVCLALALGLVVAMLASIKKPLFMESLRGKHALITGGSSGIGLAIAKAAIQEGAYVTLVSRSSTNLAEAVERLVEETQCGRDRIMCQVADVGDHGAIAGAVKGAIRWRPIDLLVCNAGITRGGYLDNTEVQDVDTVIRTNLNGTVYALHEALPSLKERSVDHPVSIVIVSSMAGLYFLYGHSVYTATKYALRGLAESLRAELVPYDNIRVTLMCPGFVNTPFLDNVSKEGEITEILRKVNLLSEKSSESPDQTATCTMEAVKRGSFLVVTQPIGLHLVALGRGLIPAGSAWEYVFEVVMLVPFRLLSLHLASCIRRDIQEGVAAHKP